MSKAKKKPGAGPSLELKPIGKLDEAEAASELARLAAEIARYD